MSARFSLVLFQTSEYSLFQILRFIYLWEQKSLYIGEENKIKKNEESIFTNLSMGKEKWKEN